MTHPQPDARGVRDPETLRNNPFVGIQPYTEAEAEWFFGRNKERRIVLANLKSTKVTVVYGPSGIGKTSLLRAGILRDAKDLAVQAPPSAPAAVAAYFDEWSASDPSSQLLATLERVLATKSAEGEESLSLGDRLRGLSESFGVQLLLILDQFEEYFLYHDSKRGRSRFVKDLAEVVSDPMQRTNVLISLRDDRLATLDQLTGSIPELLANLLPLGPLDPDAARQAIIRPIEHFNEVTGSDITIEDRLVDAVIDQTASTYPERAAATTSGADMVRAGIEAPLLQLVMTRIWETEWSAQSGRLTLATLRALGGAEQISHGHLDRTLANLGRHEERVAIEIFDRLVTPSGTKIAQEASDLEVYYQERHPRADPGHVTALLDRLASGRFRILREIPSTGKGRHFVLFHDVLGPPLRVWREQRRRELNHGRVVRRWAIAAIVFGAVSLAGVALALSTTTYRNVGAVVAVGWVAIITAIGTVLYAWRPLTSRRDMRSVVLLAGIGILLSALAAAFPVVFPRCNASRVVTLAERGLDGCDLSGAALSGKDLDEASLIGADLTGADLTNASLRQANLLAADLTGADLTGADLTSANLSYANLTNTSLRAAILKFAFLLSSEDTEIVDLLFDVEGAGSRLTGANLAGADLLGAFVSLPGVDLSNADLSGTDLRKADLSSTDLSNADLSNADLSNADLSNADLSNADLSNADLARADLTGARLPGATWHSTICPNGIIRSSPCPP